MGAGCPGEAATDQRLDDGGSLTFETEMLTEDFDVLGAPVVTLRLRSDTPVAQVSVRLSDVLPDGRVARVSYQVLNLTHRNGHYCPTPLEPGEDYDVRIQLHDCGHRFKAGHKVRVAIATGYWPLAWPAPHAATLTLTPSLCGLELPIRNSLASQDEVAFLDPAHGSRAPRTVLAQGQLQRTIARNLITGETTYVTAGEGGVFGEGTYRLDDIDTTIDHSLASEMTVSDTDPSSARTVITQRLEMGRAGWWTRLDLKTEMWCDTETFYLSAYLEVEYNGESIHSAAWQESVPRNLV